MRSVSIRAISAAICCVLVTACGGGDDSPTPTPTESPTPSPTPTPTSTPTEVDFDFSTDFTSSISNSAYAFAYFAPEGGTEVWSDGSRRNGQSQITYEVSPESVEYVWPDTLELETFTAADLLNSSPTIRTYRKGNSDGLQMELPFQHVLRVVYEKSQSFIRETVPGTLRSFRYALFFNPVTTDDDITADLSYTGTPQVAGGEAGITAVGVISSPDTTLVVGPDGDDIEINGTIRILESVNGATVERAILPLTAEVGSSGSFNGLIEDETNGFEGNFVGALAGPEREEIFVVFFAVKVDDEGNVDDEDQRKYIGSLIAN
ncbi:hypothetical protein [Qipengyuania qiaonensis]|uniref:Transferrin-binding protein B C-lobe/N-lobe beta barrel domain-containing protein n=1 Tax=Qipengyuania qiaonensis TaxID=2867240 RepID=A0ABS7JA16_9SPHN|nr:hypothetical protein [Qipengyuania qiaonensis]MBX7482820.1 hypothetical protein [Qipengyuania qiaonensis]